MGSNLLLIAVTSVQAADVTITDSLGDVWTVDCFTGESSIVTNSSEIEIDNLDLAQATYTRQGLLVNLSLQVTGIIEDRGELVDIEHENQTYFNMVEYSFQLLTSKEDYGIFYCNQTGRLVYDDVELNLTSSAFFVVGDTLSITFPVESIDEEYENLTVKTTFIKADLNNPDPSEFVYFSDIAPNPPLKIFTVSAPTYGYVGESIQFNGSVEFGAGSPPFAFLWDFGDGSTSTLQKPTHRYTFAGIYIYTFTVTDDTGATESQSGTITIYDVKKAFLFGKFTNMDTHGDFITIEAVNLRMISLKPFQYTHYSHGEIITFTNQLSGFIVANRLLIGIFYVIIQ